MGFAVKSTCGKLTELLHASINASILLSSQKKKLSPDTVIEVFILKSQLYCLRCSMFPDSSY